MKAWQGSKNSTGLRLACPPFLAQKLAIFTGVVVVCGRVGNAICLKSCEPLLKGNLTCKKLHWKYAMRVLARKNSLNYISNTQMTCVQWSFQWVEAGHPGHLGLTAPQLVVLVSDEGSDCAMTQHPNWAGHTAKGRLFRRTNAQTWNAQVVNDSSILCFCDFLILFSVFFFSNKKLLSRWHLLRSWR